VEEKLGAKFWLWVIGVTVAAGIGVILLFILIGRAWEAWGALGALIFFFLLLLAFGWVYDRRQARAYEE
jgi:hypothetical protein